jgi:Permuted papain-like amidase enzyme, YaeF/YiiX, C92 family
MHRVRLIVAYAIVRVLTISMNVRARLLLGCIAIFRALAASAQAHLDDQAYRAVLDSRPAVGDIVFTRIGGPIFANVAETTQSWTSHVGIIVDYRDGDWIVAESGIPFVRKTPLRRFLERSQEQRFSIRRLRTPPTEDQKRAMLIFADSQMGKPYALGFDLDSRNTFCSKFVHDDVFVCTQQSIGEVETFDHLLHRNPNAPLWFWRAWFLGRIPWDRTTITPASELESPLLLVVSENNA